jgi:predicted kinase
VRDRAVYPSGVVGITGDQSVDRLVYPEGSLVVIGGLPGAGKSTLTRRVRAGAVVVNPEEVASRLSGRQGHQVRAASPQVSAAMRKEITRALRQGKNVIVDAPALYPHLRAEYAVLAALEGRPAHMVLVNATPRQAQEGQASRGERIMRPSVMRRYARLRAQLNSTLRHRPEDLVDRRGLSSRYRSVTVLTRPASAKIGQITFE